MEPLETKAQEETRALPDKKEPLETQDQKDKKAIAVRKKANLWSRIAQ